MGPNGTDGVVESVMIGLLRNVTMAGLFPRHYFFCRHPAPRRGVSVVIVEVQQDPAFQRGDENDEIPAFAGMTGKKGGMTG